MRIDVKGVVKRVVIGGGLLVVVSTAAALAASAWAGAFDRTDTPRASWDDRWDDEIDDY